MTKKETAIKFESQNIKTFAEPAYLAYAMKVVKDRAIPDVRDGLKPVQRRILYSMYQLKLLSDTAKPMKCARVVGDTIGRFHPHGDSAVYEAMVRMSQPFTLRYPLVLGEGNFGSRDGDKAAAMRYTEAKLTPIASTLLDELKWDTVDYKPNYDNVLNEPSVLPSRLPFVLLNGSSGIAVGMATNLLSHNLNEVVNAAKYIISHKRLSNDKILSFMPAPDFPSGGQIISSLEDIKKIYETGRGSIRVRAKYYIEKIDKKSKNKRLVVNELPPDTSTAKIMTSIALLMDPPQTKKGKKITLKPEQLKLKKVLHDMIGKVRDGSDQDHPIHLIIEPKNQKVDLEELFKILCTFTDMEMNVSANFVCIDSKGNPRQSGIIDWLCQWCDFRVETVRRRLQDEKSRIDKQLHIINGRLSILDKIEEVIQILKSSENPKKDLMESFGLDEIQAEDVLEMKLRQVANLEKIKLLEKQEKLSKEQSRLLILLTDETKLKKEVINELSEDAKTFGDERRTELKPSEFFSHQSIFDLMMDSSNGLVDKSNLDKLSVAFTHRGWLSWQILKQNNNEDYDNEMINFDIKHGDTIKRVHCGSLLDYLLILSKKGKIYSLNLIDIQNKYNKKTGTVPLTEFFDIKNDDEFYQSLIVDKEDKIFLACSSGYGFISKAENAINRMKSGKQFLSVSKNYYPLQMEILDKKLRDKQSIVITLSSDGKSVVFPLDDVKEIPKGKGVCFMGLSKDHYMKDYKIKYNTQDLNLEHTNTRNNKKLVKLNFEDLKQLEKPRTAGRKGKALVKYPDTICFR